jgi:rubrerythrin
MKMNLKQIVKVTLVMLALICGMVFVSQSNLFSQETKAKTLENLQSAFNGESNAHARYLAFAQKADEEGYAQVASLFRAAAKAETIHAKSHSEVIKKMGGVPKANIEKVEVKSTKENLETAIKGETYEKDTMYPEFIKIAKEEKNMDALQSFNYAKTAEIEHAKLYSDALKNLDSLKGAKKIDYYVCTVCGFTTTKIDFAKCPSCFNAVDKFIKVN